MTDQQKTSDAFQETTKFSQKIQETEDIYTIAKNNFVISLLESQGIIKDKKITEEDTQLPTDILFFSRKFLVSFPSYFLFSSSSLSLFSVFGSMIV